MLKTSQKNYKEAQEYLVGGVNSPIRAFQTVGSQPLFIEQGKGSKVYDVDGHEYIDYVGSYGALVLGHAHPAVVSAVNKAVARGSSFGTPTRLETALAKEICSAFSSIDKVRFVSSGTEAAMGAIKLSRAYTKKDKIINFSGCYHGWSPYPAVTLPYNDLTAVEALIMQDHDQIAAIIVEPVAGNQGVVVPDPGFLVGLRELASQYGIILIFDEVITGFRLAYGGAQEYFGIKADLTCLGKIIGGGFPIGAFGGKKEIMEQLAPNGPVYQAGTLSGNPVAVTAGLKTLKKLKSKSAYQQLAEMTDKLCAGLDLDSARIGSMFSFKFGSDSEFSSFFWRAIKSGIYFAPARSEANFVSLAHDQNDIEETLRRLAR